MLKKKLWLLAALLISMACWAAPCLAADDSYLPYAWELVHISCAADDAYFYWISGENKDGVWEDALYQTPRRGGEKRVLSTAGSIKDINCADGRLYFIADGSLITYDLATQESRRLADWATQPSVYAGRVYYLKYISQWHKQLCCQPAAGGAETLLADYAELYWFSEGRVCYRLSSKAGYKIYSQPLAGGPAEPGYETYARTWADGWYYCCEDSDNKVDGWSKLYRWRWQNGKREFAAVLYNDFPSTFAYATSNVRVAGDTVYYTMQVFAEYEPGRWGQASTPLYAVGTAGGEPRQLTDGKVEDFYVFGDQIVYKNPWRYGEGARPDWQVLDLTK